MADVWDWVHESAQSFIDNRDRPRYEMGRLFYAGLHHIRLDPEKAIFFLDAAKTAAEKLDEPWWVILCDHWKCQVFLEHTRNVAAAAKLSNELIAKTTNDSACEGLPQLVCLHDDRAGAMLSMDPIGYATEIDADCTVIETKGAELVSCQHCSRATRIGALLYADNLQDAETLAIEGLKKCNGEGVSHYLPAYYCALCSIAVSRKDWDRLAHWAKAGDLYYGKMGSEAGNIELLMWNAVAALKLKGVDAAYAAYKKARKAGKSAGFKLTNGYYDALAIYHEENEQLKLALTARKMQLDNTSGAPHLEAICRVERARLLKASGLAIDEELDSLSSASRLLRDSSYITNRLDNVLQDV